MALHFFLVKPLGDPWSGGMLETPLLSDAGNSVCSGKDSKTKMN